MKSDSEYFINPKGNDMTSKFKESTLSNILSIQGQILSGRKCFLT